MITLQQAKSLKHGTMLYHSVKRNADKTPMRAKVLSVKTWKKSPERVLVSLKHGLRDYAKFDETELSALCLSEIEAMGVTNEEPDTFTHL